MLAALSLFFSLWQPVVHKIYPEWTRQYNQLWQANSGSWAIKYCRFANNIPNFSHNAAVVGLDILIVVRIGQYGSSQGFFR